MNPNPQTTHLTKITFGTVTPTFGKAPVTGVTIALSVEEARRLAHALDAASTASFLYSDDRGTMADAAKLIRKGLDA